MGRLPHRSIRRQPYYSRANVAARRIYTNSWFRFAGRLAGVAGGAAALGLSALPNLFSSVPKLDTRPEMSKRSRYSLSRAGRAGTENYGESRLVAQPRAVVGEVTPYVQLTRVTKKSGRPVSKKTRLSRLLQSVAQPIVTRFQNLSGMSATNGKNFFDYLPAAAGTSGNFSLFPVYAFDLTSSVNSNNEGTNIGYPMVMYRLARNRLDATPTDVANNFFWTTVNCSQADRPDATGTKIYSWMVERKPKRNVFPVGRTFFEWFDIRLMMWGAQGKPSRITVQLVHMPEGIGPRGASTTDINSDATGLDTEDPSPSDNEQTARKVNEFWLGYTDTLVSNPLNKRNAYNVPGMRVLESQTFDINPTGTETDTRGHMKMYKLFKRYNRIVNYQYERKTTLATNDATTGAVGLRYDVEANPNAWDTEGWFYVNDGAATKPRTNTWASGRLYLLVSGSVAQSGAGSAANTASFDFCIRRKQSVAANS